MVVLIKNRNTHTLVNVNVCVFLFGNKKRKKIEKI